MRVEAPLNPVGHFQQCVFAQTCRHVDRRRKLPLGARLGCKPSSSLCPSAGLMRLALFAWLLTSPAASFVLPLGGSRCRQQLQPSTLRGWMAALDDKGTDELEATIDVLVRTEVEAAFAGISQDLDTNDEEAIRLIEAKGREVMQTVLDKLEADGELLSSSLTAQIEQLSMTRQKQARETDAQRRAPARSARVRKPTRLRAISRL
eukprot:6234795-Prymnesium_polylepis.1